MGIRVVIDFRETDIWAELEAYRVFSETEGWVVEFKKLDVGDIAFFPFTPDSVETVAEAGAGTSAEKEVGAPIVVLERKTADDLGASQKDGRYREQRSRLLALRGAGSAIGYVLEAPVWTPTLTNNWCRGAFSEVHLQQTLVRLQLRYTIPVFQSVNFKDTANWIIRIARMLVADPTVFQGGVATTAVEAAAAYTDAIHVKKADNNTPERIFLHFLLAIPGLGKTAASAISTACENRMTLLQAMSLEQLADIRCGKKRLGVALATVIHTTIHS